MSKNNVTKILFLCILFFVAIIIVACTLYSVTSKDGTIVIDLPDSYSKDYREDVAGYKLVEDMLSMDWDTFEATPELSITLDTTMHSGTTFEYQSISSAVRNRSVNDSYIATLSENDAWSLITNGIITSYPTGSYSSYAKKLAELKQTNTETITVNVWYWLNPSDQEDMRKITVQKTFAVNSVLSETFQHIFEDIYNDPSQPVFNIADGGMGTWVLRGKNHNNNAGISAHALGVAIDINPSTGSFKVNGLWYGNGYGQKVMTKDIWEQLPEVHIKYHVLYDGCPIVEIFKAYGFTWGGDWSSTKDPMHLSYIGDGSNARANGTTNYLDRQ